MSTSARTPRPAAQPSEPDIETLIASLLDANLASLRANARAMLDPVLRRDPECVHQARVAVRRMRAVLRVFRKQLERQIRPARLRRAQKALGRLGGALGDARDWDVILTERLPAQRAPLARALGDAALLRVTRRAQLARARANTAARRFVAGESFVTQLVRVEDLSLTLQAAHGDEAQQTAGGATSSAAAQSALARQSARVLRLGARLADLDDAGRHRLRIETKRLRYVLELCAPLLALHATKQWLRSLKGLQDVLGSLNDARALVERLGPLGDDAVLRAQLVELARHAVLEGLPQAAALFMAWRLADAPWKSGSPSAVDPA